jgi:uncharacterized membrane protein
MNFLMNYLIILKIILLSYKMTIIMILLESLILILTIILMCKLLSAMGNGTQAFEIVDNNDINYD